MVPSLSTAASEKQNLSLKILFASALSMSLVSAAGLGYYAYLKHEEKGATPVNNINQPTPVDASNVTALNSAEQSVTDLQKVAMEHPQNTEPLTSNDLSVQTEPVDPPIKREQDALDRLIDQVNIENGQLESSLLTPERELQLEIETPQDMLPITQPEIEPTPIINKASNQNKIEKEASKPNKVVDEEPFESVSLPKNTLIKQPVSINPPELDRNNRREAIKDLHKEEASAISANLELAFEEKLKELVFIKLQADDVENEFNALKVSKRKLQEAIRKAENEKQLGAAKQQIDSAESTRMQQDIDLIEKDLLENFDRYHDDYGDKNEAYEAREKLLTKRKNDRKEKLKLLKRRQLKASHLDEYISTWTSQAQGIDESLQNVEQEMGKYKLHLGTLGEEIRKENPHGSIWLAHELNTLKRLMLRSYKPKTFKPEKPGRPNCFKRFYRWGKTRD